MLLSLLLHIALLVPGASIQPGIQGMRAVDTQDLVLRATLGPAPPQAAASTPTSPDPDKAAATSTPLPQADARGHYLAEKLSRPPRPLQEVKLDLPEAGLLTAPGQLRLTLWIDTEGRVVAYHMDAPDLPEEYTTAVAEVFASIQYVPGELLGRKVNTILKLQIDHEPASGR
ncbi:MAG: hypothetical protein O9318_05585 [Hylemonella sp.]|uniref:hypothetical protein n=1 Tax=Hylemonella sp. TaxID=2066020 RepID=UPI0022BAF947|nr:hypothetical protein [Hylemonella sp.]MCZ8251918.1 hypothetical protein [Hylemonella sp.]